MPSNVSRADLERNYPHYRVGYFAPSEGEVMSWINNVAEQGYDPFMVNVDDNGRLLVIMRHCTSAIRGQAEWAPVLKGLVPAEMKQQQQSGPPNGQAEIGGVPTEHLEQMKRQIEEELRVRKGPKHLSLCANEEAPMCEAPVNESQSNDEGD